ncbi:MAG: DUF935 family protein [Comamonas sp.]
MAQGIYVSPTKFVEFAEPRIDLNLSHEIATRDRTMSSAMFSHWLPNPDPVLKKLGKDISVYRDLRSDAHVGGSIRRRKAAVKGLEGRVVRGKASARMARIATDLIASYNRDTLINEITEAVLYGWQPLELIWGARNGVVQPLQVVGKPPEWFMFGTDGQLRFRSREAPLVGEPLAPRKFILAQQEATYANPYGHADLSMCFWPTVFKRGGLKFWAKFTEKYGSPWLVAKTPRGTPEHQNNQLLDKMEAMLQDAVAVIPDDSSIDTIEAGDKGASASLYKELLMFCRSEVSIALLGQNQSTEATANRASAEAGLEVASVIRDGDGKLASATITQLLRYVTDINESPEAPAPTYELYEEDSLNNAMAQRDESLGRGGVKFTNQYWMRTYKLQDGDIDEQASVTAPVLPTSEPPVQFSEPGQAVGDADAKALSQASAPAVLDWVKQLRGLVESYSDPVKLQDALMQAYGDLPADELTELMALAFELAHLQGREAVQGNING